MVTLVRLRDELRKCFSVLDGVENRNINLYKSDNKKNEGVLLESDTMLNEFVWGSFYRVDVAIIIKVNQADHN